MFYPYKDGSTVKLQELIINIPPVGYVYDERTEQLEYVGVYERSPEPHLQYWQREPLPNWYNHRRQDEIENQKVDPDYRDAKIAEYITGQWDKRICGVWFMNNGKPTYITGLHWFYLNWWYLDGYYPDYRDTDREFFYVWKYVEQDPNCMGLIEVTRRRQGKTYRGTCMLYEYTSSREYKRAGIQSKSEEDAKENVFQSKLMVPFRELPDFWVPEIDMAQGYGAKNELRFFRTQNRGKRATESLGKPELKSQITVRNGKPKAFDGYPLHRYLNDEAGKDENYDVYERHGVNYFCCLKGSQVVGKMLYTTTVEEMESGGGHFKRLWDASDQTTLSKDVKQTASGLYQYFLPAHRGVRYNKYGIPDEKANLEEIHAKRKQLQSDTRALASYIRKAPLRIEEAFYKDSSNCLFNAYKLEKQREVLMVKEGITVRGDLIWRNNEKDTIVEFVENRNGRFQFAYMEFGENALNQVRRSGRFRPMADNKFVASCDPYAMAHLADGATGSNAAAYILKKGSVMSDNIYDNAPIVQYLGRPQHIKLFYEDMIKMCSYFGCQMLVENNVAGLLLYFEERGYEEFLMWMPDGTKPGISAHISNKTEAAQEIEWYVEKFSHKMFFVELIEDLLEFDIKNTQKYDAAMAFGWLLLANKKTQFVERGPQGDEINLYEIFGAQKRSAV
jgi:hypothetical protein